MITKEMIDRINELAKKKKTEPLLVNIYGQPPSVDNTFRGDLEEIQRVLETIGVKTNTFFIRQDGVEQLKNSGNAALNINISPWLGKNIDTFFQVKFGIPTLTFNGWPIGPKDVANFLRTVAAKLNELNPGTIDSEVVEKAVKAEEQYVYEYLDSLMGTFERQRFVIVGDSAKVLGIMRFLVNIHGHIPLAAIFTDTVPAKNRQTIIDEVANLDCNRKADVFFETDTYEIEDLVKKYGDGKATLLIGSSFDKRAAQAIGAFFVIATNPNLGSKILNKTHIGTKGCVTFIEDMYNHY